MQAMIFAAGLGTRLRPLTETKPKALLGINGIPLLEIVFRRLLAVGVREIIVNVHHLPDQIASFLKARQNFGVRVELSYEERLLDTGGGLKQADYFFDQSKPFFVHNVDVISNIDLLRMYEHHLTHGNLATLAVMPRSTSRYLIFDETGALCGWKSLKEHRVELTRTPNGATTDLAFCGIHVISPALLQMITEEGSFSILKTYLRVAGEGERIKTFRADEYFWRDVGKREQLPQIEKEVRERKI